MRVDGILRRAMDGEALDRERALALLGIENGSEDFYRLLSAANRLTRSEFKNRGYIFAQIGVNAEPCPKNCRFCSMGATHYAMESQWRKDAGTIIKEVEFLVKQGVDDVFLMTTADYPMDQYIEIAGRARRIVPEGIRFVANVGDFDLTTARQLKSAGVTGVYHIRRLREGTDTDIAPEDRIRTLNAIRYAGLELYYCVEPIGPEHAHEELVEEMIRAREYGAGVMAVMRRVPVKGTPLYEKGQISAMELAKIAAAARLVSRPARAMNAHEVTPMTLLAGVNQLYAEYGANPRDNESNTEKGRAYTVDAVRRLLSDAEYTL